MQNGIIQSKPLDPFITDPHRVLDEDMQRYVIQHIIDLVSDPDLVKFKARTDFTITISLDDNGHPIAVQSMENRRP